MGYMSAWRTCRIRRLEQLKPPNHKKSAVSSKDVFWTPKEDTVLNWNTGWREFTSLLGQDTSAFPKLLYLHWVSFPLFCSSTKRNKERKSL